MSPVRAWWVGLLCAACAREPLPQVCPELPVGGLVVSELRGPQTGADTGGQWIELLNTTDAAVDLGGLTIDITRLDGGGRQQIVVRDPGVEVGARAFVVLGGFTQADRPSSVDYGYASDLAQDLYPGGIIDVRACGQVLDSVVYRDLPRRGTWAYGAAEPLSAEANDPEDRWCIDAAAGPSEDGGGGDGEALGTPREQNRPCA